MYDITKQEYTKNQEYIAQNKEQLTKEIATTAQGIQDLIGKLTKATEWLKPFTLSKIQKARQLIQRMVYSASYKQATGKNRSIFWHSKSQPMKSLVVASEQNQFKEEIQQSLLYEYDDEKIVPGNKK